MSNINEFRVTRDRHVYIGKTEIKPIYSIDIHIEPCEDAKVTLCTLIDGTNAMIQISAERLSIDGYMDLVLHHDAANQDGTKI